MRILLCLALAALGFARNHFVPPEAGSAAAALQDFQALRAEAEARYAEKSWSLAHELYQRAAALELTPEERRWVQFRLGDSGWRAAASSQDPDPSEHELALESLQKLLASYERPEARDDLWALLHESLGDASWTERRQDWGTAWSHYQEALTWWARSSDLERARRRYLDIVWRTALPDWRERYWGWNYFPTYVGPEILQNAADIATEASDRGRAHFLLGRAWMDRGVDVRTCERVEREFALVLELGRSGEWYDDALANLAGYYERGGRFVEQENGPPQSRPDYVRALELFRRLVSEFKKGETRYWDQATARIRDITAPDLSLQVDRFFLPGSRVSYQLGWRNVARVELGLHPVDLTRHVSFASARSDDWLERLPIAAGESWTFDTEDDGLHEPDRRALERTSKVAPGAYVLLARAGGVERRALVLVSDAALSLKASGTQLLVWATEVQGGRPIPDADVRVFQRWHDGQDWRRRELDGQTAADGTVLFEIDRTSSSGGQLLVTMRSAERQSFASSWNPGAPSAAQEWRVYAQTDRAAYRPGDTVQWSAWARRRFADEYSTPSGAPLAWEVVDPQGSVVAKGQAELNAFGALWERLETTETMTLGEYTARFFDGARDMNRNIGAATLFRLEEYKLPEYEVTVGTPDDPERPGSPRLYVVGDRVEAEIGAEYYSGGPVADATVEVIVFQKPRYWYPKRTREFPWFYADPRQDYWGGNGQEVLHQTLQTDGAGQARVAFDTPLDSGTDLEYVIEARVTDASRREIVGQGTVIVGRQTYRVEARVEHAIHRPGARVEVEFRAADLNGNPVAAEGRVRVTRERWLEVWTDPSGREVTGGELRRLQSGGREFPPPGVPGWQPKFRGYESQPVFEGPVRSAADGKASMAFTPTSDGYYRVSWSSVDARHIEVTAEASVFVADEDSRELGYLPGGIEILVDRDTVRVGEDCSALLLAPASGRFVLFTVEGEDLYHFEVVELTGQVKLMRVPITAAHVPNVTLGALSVFGAQAYSDAEELIVPPVERFLEVEVAGDHAEYEPGQEGQLAITVRDHAGEPVRTLLSLAVVDEAIAYIQSDYAVDPRQFFYGEKRPRLVNTAGTFQSGRFWSTEQDGRSAGVGGDFRNDADDRFGQRAKEERLGMLKAGRSAPAAPEAESMARGARAQVADSAVEGGPAPAVRVRSDFRATALWLPDVSTDAAGQARVTLTFPDSTTRWRAQARACDTSTRVGQGQTSVRTRLPLMARLQAPRFFTVGDEVTLSGNLQNDTDQPLTVTPRLEVEGLVLLGHLVGDAWTPGEVPPVRVPAHGQVRVDWRVSAAAAGQARVRLSAVAGELGDALERVYPVEDHGIEAFVNVAGRSDGAGVEFDLTLPAARRQDSTVFRVQVAPSLAVTMLDALPYLLDYPYGCVEQTLSRFLPAVIVARALRDSGLSAEQAMERAFGGIEGQFAAQTHGKGKTSLARLDEITRAGLERLYDFQHGDGSWSWWKEGEGDPYMTAYVLWGLALARDAGLDVRAGVLENGVRWLARELVEAEDQPDLQAWLLHAMAVSGSPGLGVDERGFRDTAFERLWTGRERLNAYGRALLALSARALGREDVVRVLVDNLRNGAKIDRSPDTSIVQVGAQAGQPFTQATAHWGPDRMGRRWNESPVETTAFVLRALCALAPQDELVGPTMNWLVKNRRGAQWSNTRDTAITVLALTEYLRSSGELGQEAGFRIEVNGQLVAERQLTRDELLAAPSTFEVDRELLRDGANRVRITRTRGATPLYFSARATFFSLEEPIPSRGSEIFVRRELYRLAARPTLLAGTLYERVLLEDGDLLRSGERVEVVLTFEAKNDLEYLVFEDLKAAGLEAVAVRSGEPIAARELKSREAAARFGEDNDEARRRRAGTDRGTRLEPGLDDGGTGRRRSAHQELRDRKVAFFLDKLPQGTWELRYDLRAEVPGRFHALPTMAHAMYVPEIRANGEELRLEVR